MAYRIAGIDVHKKMLAFTRVITRFVHSPIPHVPPPAQNGDPTRDRRTPTGARAPGAERQNTNYPTVRVRQLEVSHPRADDDGLWFFQSPDSEAEVQGGHQCM